MKNKVQRPKGTADVTAAQAHIWHYVEHLLSDVAHLFGFEEMRTPTFEHTELFLRGVGDTTDIVQKEMYTFQDKGDRSITLKPEGTAGVVRSYLENGIIGQGAPFKCYYITPVFRYEKPQAGRFREHHQFGVECFGADSYKADAEVISLVYTFLNKLDIKSVVRLNSIGCPKCRPAYNQKLKAYFEGYRDQLCETCLERLEKNPTRIIDCKSPICSGIAKEAPRSIDNLCEECHDHFEGVKASLSMLDIPYEIDSNIVRGLDYYTKTVFEFIGIGLGSQSTVCGGGRYDGLVEELGGPATPGIGFGCGIERLILTAQASGHTFPPFYAPQLVLVAADKAGEELCTKLAFALRQEGISVESDLCGRSVKAQMKHADRLGCSYTIVLGESEVNSNSAVLKNMKTGEGQPVSLNVQEIAKVVKSC